MLPDEKRRTDRSVRSLSGGATRCFVLGIIFCFEFNVVEGAGGKRTDQQENSSCQYNK